MRLLNKLTPRLCQWSIERAGKEQGLLELRHRLEEIVPNISQQYNSTTLKDRYNLTKVRTQQAFQVSLALEALKMLDIGSIMDIGDSAGTHLTYIVTLSHKAMKLCSMNTDTRAIIKIRAKGLTAIKADATEYDWNSEKWDLVTAFEVLEHLSDPIRFLLNLKDSECRLFVMTVPYLRESRVYPDRVGDNEDNHIHELCPGDWKFLFALTGWEVIEEKTYWQFPQRVFGWGELAAFWERNDFLGFWGAILRCR